MNCIDRHNLSYSDTASRLSAGKNFTLIFKVYRPMLTHILAWVLRLFGLTVWYQPFLNIMPLCFPASTRFKYLSEMFIPTYQFVQYYNPNNVSNVCRNTLLICSELQVLQKRSNGSQETVTNRYSNFFFHKSERYLAPWFLFSCFTR
jgi:hypothetical protein